MTNFLDKVGLQYYTEKIKAYIRFIVGSDVQQHELRTDNPHLVTKGQVGLGNVTNEAQIPLSQKGVASGVATLGTDGKLTAAQLPALKSVNGVSVVGSGNISIDLSLYKVVDSLPTTGIDATKIYIVPAQTTGDKNIKVEYVYTGDPTSAYDASKWEKLGEAQTNIVVDAYLSDTSINPVQNRTVKTAVDNLSNSITSINGTLGELSSRISKASIDNTRQDTAIEGKLDKTDYVVDAELNVDSTNPIQNKAVKSAIDTLKQSITDVENKNIAQDLALTKKLDKTDYVVDADLSETSTNPLQNKTVYEYYTFLTTTVDAELEKKLSKKDYVVDNELSPTSKNPVQNLVVYQKFDWFDKNIRNKAYVQINAKIPSTPQAAIGTSWALVPNPVTSEAYADDGGWHGRELTFSSALFATKEGLDSCMKKTDMTAITNEEIDAMF